MTDLFVALTPMNLLACFAGVVLGTIVGVLPGLGPAGAMALVLPLTIKLGPTAGLIMLAGIYYGSMYGGSTTSILVNVPGEAASVVTTIDGYRLARKGRAGAALAIAAIASFVAGTFSVVALQLAAPFVARLALAFGPSEFFAFALLGVILLANLTGGSRVKSLAMVVTGVMLSTVGMDPLGGTVRFTFDVAGAQAGLSFIAVTAGLFGVAEVLATMAQPAATAPVARVRFRALYPSREELRRSVPSMLRGTVLGFLVGLIPGPAATIASFVSYGVEKRVSRYRHEIGTGAIEGVAGPEAANNAAAGGGMIPLLSLGLPFTPSTAVLLSGMLLMSVTPGPFLLRDHPQVFWGVIGSFYVGNVMLLLLNLPLVGIFARVATIPQRYLMPGVLVLCAVAAYSDNNNAFDVWVMVGAGVLGYAIRGLGYDPAPLVLGLVLGPVLERSLLQALTIGRGELRELWSSAPAAIMLATGGGAGAGRSRGSATLDAWARDQAAGITIADGRGQIYAFDGGRQARHPLPLKGDLRMDIERHLIMDSADAKPIISRVVAQGDRVYVCGITGDPVGDVTAQTKQALARVDHLPAQAGTDKSKLLTAQVWLSDMRLFRTHNLAWNEWVDPEHPPVRACVQAELFAPGLLVEVMVTAAR